MSEEKKVRADWDAIERDYRTGKFTLRELESKHGANNATISRKAKRDGWTQDLSAAIKQATNARLIESVVEVECSKAQQNTAETVLAAADVNVRVITGHRKRLTDLYALADSAQAKLEEMGECLNDIKEAAVFVQAVGNLTTMTKTLITEERRAFGLDDDEHKKSESYEDLLMAAQVLASNG